MIVSSVRHIMSSIQESYGGGTLDGMVVIFLSETSGVAVGFEEPGSVLTVGIDMMVV